MRGRQPRALFLLPTISGLWLAIGVSIVGTLTPGYSHISQFMSALGAVGAPLATWTNFAIFIPTEIWFLGFLVILNRRLQHSGTSRIAVCLLFAYAILLILAAFLPCDFGCNTMSSDHNQTNTAVHLIHLTVAAIAYPLAVIGMFFLNVATLRTSFLHRFSVPTMILGFCLFFAIILVPDAQGLFQRLLEAWLYLQFILLGFYAASIEPLTAHGTA